MRADTGAEAYRRLAPLVTPRSVIDTCTPAWWRESERGPLPKDLRALDLITPDERADLEAAGGGLRLVHLNEYATKRRYSGPEEGGWCYDDGRFVACRGTFPTVPEARDELAQDVKARRKGLHPPGDARCTGWPELVIEDRAGANYPAEPPRFE